MARDFIQVQAGNLDTMMDAMRKAPDLAYKWSRVAMGRGLNAERKSFIRDDMSGGAQGINWRTSGTNARKIGGNVKTDVRGNQLEDLSGRIGISSFLAVHERGITIDNKNFMYIRDRSGVKRFDLNIPGVGWRKVSSAATVLRRVTKVTLPARLGFVKHAESKGPGIIAERVNAAMVRAMDEAFAQRVRGIAQDIERLAT